MLSTFLRKNFFLQLSTLLFALILTGVSFSFVHAATQPWFCDLDLKGYQTKETCETSCRDSKGEPACKETAVAPANPQKGWHCQTLSRDVDTQLIPTEADCKAVCRNPDGTQGICTEVGATPTAAGVGGPPPVGDFVPLTNLPGLTDQPKGGRSLADYLNVLFRLSIGIGALAGVLKIAFAGVKYMSSDAFSSKEEAKKDITAALLGLLIMLSTVVVLKFIYPDILNLNVLGKLKETQILTASPNNPPHNPPPRYRELPSDEKISGWCGNLRTKVCGITSPASCKRTEGVFFSGQTAAVRAKCVRFTSTGSDEIIDTTD